MQISEHLRLPYWNGSTCQNLTYRKPPPAHRYWAVGFIPLFTSLPKVDESGRVRNVLRRVALL